MTQKHFVILQDEAALQSNCLLADNRRANRTEWSRIMSHFTGVCVWHQAPDVCDLEMWGSEQNKHPETFTTFWQFNITVKLIFAFKPNGNWMLCKNRKLNNGMSSSSTVKLLIWCFNGIIAWKWKSARMKTHSLTSDSFLQTSVFLDPPDY